jgi:hypothetical protein
VIEELSELCRVIKPQSAEHKRPKKLHIHLFPARLRHSRHDQNHADMRPSSIFAKDTEEEQKLSVKEALAILENKPFTPSTPDFWQSIDAINRFFKTDQSMYALKVAAISSVFSVMCTCGLASKFLAQSTERHPLVYAPATRVWFNNFAMQASLLATLVAFEPTIGRFSDPLSKRNLN